jgi:hypothetical protein
VVGVDVLVRNHIAVTVGVLVADGVVFAFVGTWLAVRRDVP